MPALTETPGDAFYFPFDKSAVTKLKCVFVLRFLRETLRELRATHPILMPVSRELILCAKEKVANEDGDCRTYTQQKHYETYLASTRLGPFLPSEMR